jgi:(R,R)-butanediol dehydrogenase/meso-butanediol dehydrogenase/diacetyl reductase
MKAVRLHAPGDLRVEDVEPPRAPPAGWARVKVEVAGICGSDIHNFRTGQWITRAPSVAGHEFSGTVIEVAGDVTRLAPGDRVVADSRLWCGECTACRAGRHQLCARLGFVGEACDGGFAEQVLLPARLLHRIPSGLPSDIAAMAEPMAVALHAAGRLRPARGEPVLVAGCGPIGGLAALALAEQGFGPLVVADRNPHRAALVADVTGAGIVALDAASAGAGIAAAIEATGSIAALRAMLAFMPGGGSIALVGISHGELNLDPNLLVEREISLIGCHAFAGELPEAIAMLQAGAPRVARLVDAEISLDEVPAAYARIAAGACKGLKTLIRI